MRWVRDILTCRREVKGHADFQRSELGKVLILLVREHKVRFCFFSLSFGDLVARDSRERREVGRKEKAGRHREKRG